MKKNCFYKEHFLKIVFIKFKIIKIAIIIISLLIVSQPAFADVLQSDNYIPLEESNVLPLISSSDVIKIGEMEPNKQLSITIGLKFRNKDQLKQNIKSAHAIGKSGRVISAENMDDNFLPSKNSSDEVVKFLTNSGLKIIKTYNSHMVIKASGSAEDIEKAFKINVNYYSQNGVEFFANSNQPELPADITGMVENIDGINNFKLNTSLSYNKVSSQSLNTSAFTPQQIQKAYNLSAVYANNINGKGVKIAIATYDSFDQNDINNFINTFSIRGTNPISVINVDGTPQYDSNGSEETTMDIECSLSSAPGSQLLVYDGANPDTITETDLFTQIVDDGQANVVSYSWGNDEQNYSQSELTEMDNIFMAGTAKGMTFVVASGDNGSNDINYPATDPYVTAVGGTSMKINSSSGAISSELGWSLDDNENGSGGGSSLFFPVPSWQQGVTSLNTGHRMVPDVSLDADPNTGYKIYSGRSWDEVGGTSASTPEWAAIFALVDQSRESKGLGTIGLANPALYSLQKASVFNDITSGSNGKYSALTGYDMVTGLGSVDAFKLVNILSSLNTQTSTVIYNGNGNKAGSVPVDSNAHVQGNTVNVSGNVGNLTKVGYSFIGWNTAVDGSGTNYGANSTLIIGSSNITLYANWKSIYPTIGCLDSPTIGQNISGSKMFSGWFLDGNGVKKIEILVDGTVLEAATCGDIRGDVQRAYPSYKTTNSGYHYNVDTTRITNGSHKIVIRETANNNSQTNLSGRNVIVSNPAFGCLDTPTNGQTISKTKIISGWFIDTTGVKKIEVLVDGTVVGEATYGDLRNDVEKIYPSYKIMDSGYHYSLDTTKITNGSHKIIIRETGNNNSQINTKVLTVNVSNI